MAARKKATPRFDLKYVLLCEEVRMELAGKMTLLGYYGAETIIVGESPAVLRGLAFVFAFDTVGGGESPRRATFSLVGPGGVRPLPELQIDLTPPATPSARRNVVVQTAGLQIEVGEYTATLDVEGQGLASSFTIRHDAALIDRLRQAEDARHLV